MTILGIDPGLASSGWGVIEWAGNRLTYRAHGCVETEKNTAQNDRLLAIYNEINRVIAAYRPEAAAVETLFFARNAKTAMPVGEARGVLTLALALAAVPVKEFSPNAIKLAVTGVACADKRQVQEMTRLILGLDEIPRPDHAADALAAAICAAHNVPAVYDVAD